MSLLFHIRCILLFFIFIQFASLYETYAYDINHPNLIKSSFNHELNPSIENNNDDILTINDDNNDDDDWNLNSKRSMTLQAVPQRRNSRPHWNPLVAAYKRCRELVSRVESEACFKEAVQMLFVHKLRK
ncbi:unnamed protein product [Adineta steineri]|uniref:Uncharacterized protein n=1 Tax=Adineta steineri TaxID=433720 RepID=A0A819EJD6_9BILA|nr:unnamed protein product [Adineta steineri]CAF1459424.1 unnamed protein product [Adineta steineri]CAF1583610.1 unnamed protein product [Adineta steineri]CAF3850332.1 unnamed protein product [Adineta steineri]